MDHFDKMASNLLKDMGNKESLNQPETDGSSPVVETGEAMRIQERAIAGMEKNDQNVSKAFKYDGSVSAKDNTQYSKSAESRKPVSDTPPPRPQAQQVAGHPGFNQDMTSSKDFLQSYANMQQSMFAGYANGTSAFNGSMIPPMLIQQPMQVPANLPGMFQAGFMYQAFPEPKSSYPKSHYFPPFAKGSLIMLSTGGLKPIEELKTVDFIESAKVSKQLSLETCKIAKIQEVPHSAITLIGFAVEDCEKEVLVEKPSDHPFYVYEQGWASCKPDATLAQYGLPCQQLKVGDVCVFLSDRIDSRSDKLTGFETTSVDDRRKQPSLGEPNKFLASQTVGGREQLSRDGQQQNGGNKPEIGYKKGSPFEIVEKSDDNSFGQPAVKKAKMDVVAGKNIQDGVKN